MGISGGWAARQQNQYTGATKWGTGVNPIHGVRFAGRGRVVGARGTLLPLSAEQPGTVDPGLTSRELDWVCENYQDGTGEGESFRYQDERPRWGTGGTTFRDDTNSPAMGEQDAWGVYFDNDPSDIWPLPGPTGGTQIWMDVDHGERVERQHSIQAFTRPVTGGWKSKQRGALAVDTSTQDVTGDGYTFTLNNATHQGQGVQRSLNDRATGRGTDAAREPIVSRTAGMAEKAYAMSFGMGGGPGTPDMQPFQITAGLRRPFVTRVAALPPDELHFFNSMEGRSPISRVIPPDPYQGDPEYGGPDDMIEGWSY